LVFDKYYFVKDEIKSKISIHDVLEYYNAKISLSTSCEVRSNCVLHDGYGDNNFSWDLESKLWTCYSHNCGDGNGARDVYLFIKLAEHCSFKRAIQIASKISGISLDTKYDKDVLDKMQCEKYASQKLKSIEAVDYKVIDEKLLSEYRENYSTYMDSRGFDQDIIDYFELGYSKDGINEGTNSKYPGRIMIPLRNKDGELLGLSGRLATDSKTLLDKHHKYQITPGFPKGNVLYNLHNAKEAIKDTKEVIVCEGFFDVMRLYSYGVENVVATMGSGFTNNQFHLVWNDADVVYLCLDNDTAGQDGARKVAERLVDIKPVYIITLPKGKDPDNITMEEFWAAYSRAEKYVRKNSCMCL